MRKFWSGLMAVVLFMGGACAWLLWTKLRELEHHAFLEGSGWESKLSRFIEDERALAEDAWFRGGPGTLTVPADLVAAASSAPDDGRDEWKVQALIAAGAPPVGMSFHWMSKLAKFDRWEGASPRWGSWAKGRYRVAAAKGKWLEAFREVRELARLAGTTERWADAMAMVAILRLERDLFQDLSAKGKAPPGFRPFEADTIQRARRVFGAVGDFFSYRWPPAFVAAVFGDPTHRVGLCQGIEMQLPVQLHLRPFLESAYPDRYRVLDQTLVVTQPICRLAEQRKAWADRSEPPASRKGGLFQQIDVGRVPAAEGPVAFDEWKRFSRVPFLKRFYGLILTGVANPEPALGRLYP